MAASGFEDFEKRLELQFFGDDPLENMELRLIYFESIEQVLCVVNCTVVSIVGKHFFDAYVLSKSSLFVYPNKIIIKTCDTTHLLKWVRTLIHFADKLNLTLCECHYTRGRFIFPKLHDALDVDDPFVTINMNDFPFVAFVGLTNNLDLIVLANQHGPNIVLGPHIG